MIQSRNIEILPVENAEDSHFRRGKRGRIPRRGESPFSGVVPRMEARAVPEARLEDSGSGLAPTSEGWFVVNVRDAMC